MIEVYTCVSSFSGHVYTCSYNIIGYIFECSSMHMHASAVYVGEMNINKTL